MDFFLCCTTTRDSRQKTLLKMTWRQSYQHHNTRDTHLASTSAVGLCRGSTASRCCSHMQRLLQAEFCLSTLSFPLKITLDMKEFNVIKYDGFIFSLDRKPCAVGRGGCKARCSSICCKDEMSSLFPMICHFVTKQPHGNDTLQFFTL